MRVAPVSGDLLVKLAMGAAVIGALVWLGRKAAAMTPSADQVLSAARAAADSINPLNNNNVFAQGANAATSALAGRPETLGGWLRGATSSDDQRIQDMLNGTPPAASGDVYPQWDVTPTGGGYVAGTYNNPSAYSADTSAPAIFIRRL